MVADTARTRIIPAPKPKTNVCDWCVAHLHAECHEPDCQCECRKHPHHPAAKREKK